jgi:hypothetical protein
MITVQIIECKTCYAKYLGSDERISIGAYEEVDLIVRRIAKCSECKQRENRSVSGPKKRFQR